MTSLFNLGFIAGMRAVKTTHAPVTWRRLHPQERLHATDEMYFTATKTWTPVKHALARTTCGNLIVRRLVTWLEPGVVRVLDSGERSSPIDSHIESPIPGLKSWGVRKWDAHVEHRAWLTARAELAHVENTFARLEAPNGTPGVQAVPGLKPVEREVGLDEPTGEEFESWGARSTLPGMTRKERV